MQSSAENNRNEIEDKRALMRREISNVEKRPNIKGHAGRKLQAGCVIRRKLNVETKVRAIKSRK